MFKCFPRSGSLYTAESTAESTDFCWVVAMFVLLAFTPRVPSRHGSLHSTGPITQPRDSAMSRQSSAFGRGLGGSPR